MVEDDPYGQNSIQVRLVGEYIPLPALKVDAFHVHDQCLFACGQGKRTHAAFVVVEVVYLALMVHEGFALGHAIQKDCAVGRFAGHGSGDREPGLDVNI